MLDIEATVLHKVESIVEVADREIVFREVFEKKAGEDEVGYKCVVSTKFLNREEDYFIDIKNFSSSYTERLLEFSKAIFVRKYHKIEGMEDEIKSASLERKAEKFLYYFTVYFKLLKDDEEFPLVSRQEEITFDAKYDKLMWSLKVYKGKNEERENSLTVAYDNIKNKVKIKSQKDVNSLYNLLRVLNNSEKLNPVSTLLSIDKNIKTNVNRLHQIRK